MIGKIFGILPSDIGVDLGTSNTLVNVKGQGIVLREPSVVAVRAGTTTVLAVGDEAKRMLGRTPENITAVRPLRGGVVTDVAMTREMLRQFIDRVMHGKTNAKLRMVVAVPTGMTELEKGAVREAATQAGAREVFLLEKPMAAAIGVGLPVQESEANMIVDIGGGTTEIGVISLSGMVYARSVRVAGDDLDEAIATYLRRAYQLAVGERTAEDVKILIGSAAPLRQELGMEVKGRDIIAGLPKTIGITSAEIRDALRKPLDAIAEGVRVALERCPPELSADLVDRGFVLAGGGGLLRGIDDRLREETGLPVHVAEDPLSAVAEGAARVLDELPFLKRLTMMGV